MRQLVLQPAPSALSAMRASGPAMSVDFGKTPVAPPRPGDRESPGFDSFDQAEALDECSAAPPAAPLPSEITTHQRSLLVDAKNRFALHASVWDAAFFIGSPQLTCSDSFFVAALLLVNIIVLVVFLGIVYSVFAQENYTSDLVQRLEQWRINFGHNFKYYDENTMTSLTQRVCSPHLYQVEMSGHTSNLVQQIQEYIGESKFFNGPSLVTVSLLLWALTVITDITQIWDLSRALRSLPKADATMTSLADGDKQSLKLTSIGRGRTAWLFCVILFRTVSSCCLWFLGTRFLCLYSISVADILLNALALEIILKIDEALFILAPWRVKTLISRLEPLPSPPRCCRAGARDLRPYVLLAMVVASVLGGSITALESVRETIVEANATLCNGVQDFVYSMDAFLVVYTSESNPNGESASQLARFGHMQAVRETMYPETVPMFTRGSATVPHTMAVRFPISPLEEVKKRESWDIAQSSAGLQSATGLLCNDTLALTLDTSRFIFESLDAFVGSSLEEAAAAVSQVQTCADVKPLCGGWSLVRAACPETCGCASPVGELFLTGPAFGCPEVCPTTPWYLARQASLPCFEPTPAELQTDPLWLGWAAQFAVEVNAVFRGAPDMIPCDDCAELFRSQGCGIVNVWTDLVEGILNMKVDPCSGNWLSSWLRLRPLSTYCPVECGCAASSGPRTLSDVLAAGCPGECATAP